MYRISSSYVGMLVAMLQAEGLDAVRLCREAGIDMCLLAQEDAFFTRASAYRLMALAELDSDNPNLGLKAAVHFKPGSFQLVGYVMMSSPNLKQALEHFVRFHLLLGNGVTLALSPEQGGRMRLTCLEHPEEGSPRNRVIEDAGAAALLSFCRWLMGGGCRNRCNSILSMTSRRISLNISSCSGVRYVSVPSTLVSCSTSKSCCAR